MRTTTISLLVLSVIITFAACQNAPGEQGGGVPEIPTTDSITAVLDSAGHVVAYDSAGMRIPVDAYDKSVKLFDLRAEMRHGQFDSLKSAELERLLIRPIYSKVFDLNDETGEDNDSLVVAQLTPGQRALYLFRKMDDAITEGGTRGLFDSAAFRHLTDSTTVMTVLGSDKLDQLMAEAVENYEEKPAGTPMDVRRKSPSSAFQETFNDEYIKHQNEFYKKLEAYIRNHPEEFVNFSD